MPPHGATKRAGPWAGPVRRLSAPAQRQRFVSYNMKMRTNPARYHLRGKAWRATGPTLSQMFPYICVCRGVPTAGSGLQTHTKHYGASARKEVCGKITFSCTPAGTAGARLPARLHRRPSEPKTQAALAGRCG